MKRIAMAKLGVSIKTGHKPLVPINQQVFNRCGAKAKRTGLACQGPAMHNGRCRLHGGKSTGPRTLEGKQRLREVHTKHGFYSQEIKQFSGLYRKFKAELNRLF